MLQSVKIRIKFFFNAEECYVIDTICVKDTYLPDCHWNLQRDVQESGEDNWITATVQGGKMPSRDTFL